MNRVTTYAGATPSAKDHLRNGQFFMIALAKIAAAVMGETTIVNGFTCAPTTPSASLNVVLGGGEIYQLENIEASAWSVMDTDTRTILKQGVMLDPVLVGMTPPSTSGYSQDFLIQVQYQDSDDDLAVLNYYNAANPSQPFYGPPVAGTGSGQAQSTTRKGIVAYQVKAGVAAASGTQVTPSADAGWTGLFVVTLANGATSISSGNIRTLDSAPFIPVKLPALPRWVQGGSYSFGTDTGTANAIVANLVPVPTAYTAGMRIAIKKIASANTGAVTINLNGLGAVSLVDSTGSPLSAGALPSGVIVEARYTGSVFALIGGSTSYNNTSGFTANSGEGVQVTIPTATVTISNASPGVVSGMTLPNGTAVQLTTTGALPNPLVAGQTYYTVGASGSTVQLATSPGGTPINTTTAGSGVHTLNAVGAGTVNLNFAGLSNDATPASADIFARLKVATGHHVGMTAAQMISWLNTVLDFITEIPPNGPGVEVGQFLLQSLTLNMYASVGDFWTPGVKQATGAQLAAGTVSGFVGQQQTGVSTTIGGFSHPMCTVVGTPAGTWELRGYFVTQSTTISPQWIAIWVRIA